jgi:hypothetical protein
VAREDAWWPHCSQRYIFLILFFGVDDSETKSYFLKFRYEKINLDSVPLLLIKLVWKNLLPSLFHSLNLKTWSCANNKQAKINFLKVVNYILVKHNLFSNNLSNDILCAHHVFLSYSNLGYLIMRWYYILYFYKALHTLFFIFFRKLFMRLGGSEVLDFFQSVQKANYYFADVNSLHLTFTWLRGWRDVHRGSLEKLGVCPISNPFI